MPGGMGLCLCMGTRLYVDGPVLCSMFLRLMWNMFRLSFNFLVLVLLTSWYGFMRNLEFGGFYNDLILSDLLKAGGPELVPALRSGVLFW